MIENIFSIFFKKNYDIEMSEFQVTRLLGYWLSSTKIIFEDRSSKFSSKIKIRDFLVP